MAESLVVALATNYKSAKMGISASRRAKRKRVSQQDDNSAPLKKMKKNRRFLPYEEAKKVVNALGLKSRVDWRRWSRTERPPDIIPSHPEKIYKNAGWNGLADWLGKKKGSAFLPYEEAKKVVNALGLKSRDDWRRWSRMERPPDIPSHPQRSYKNAGWNGFADWLGKKKGWAFLPYEEAKKVVNALGLKNQHDWWRWSRTERPPDIPSHPWSFYKNAGWNGLPDWLGKKNRPEFLRYEEAKKVDNALVLKNRVDRQRWSRTERLPDIPSATEQDLVRHSFTIECAEESFSFVDGFKIIEMSANTKNNVPDVPGGIRKNALFRSGNQKGEGKSGENCQRFLEYI
eukprot:g3293.t1